MSTDGGSEFEPAAIGEFNQSLRRDIYATAAAGLTQKAPKQSTYRIHPGHIPDERQQFVTKPVKDHPQDVVDFMVHFFLFQCLRVHIFININLIIIYLFSWWLQFKKQNETRATYRKERKEAREKATNRHLTEYVPPVSLYAPPIQHYDKHRPYFQEYIRYRNELNPVVMPIFTVAKGSIRDRAQSSFMPVPDPNKVSKRDLYNEERLAKVREEEKEAIKTKKILQEKRLKETQRQREERQMNLLTSPIKSCRSRPSTGFLSHRSPQSSGGGSRPGTCNSFSPAALTHNNRPDYPTAGTVWITDV